MKKSFLFVIIILLIQIANAQIFTHKYLNVTAEFTHSGILEPYEVLHIHIENRSLRKVVVWLPSWSMTALDEKKPMTIIQPGNNQSLNYVYLGFGQSSKHSIHGNILLNFVHLNYSGIEGHKGVLKYLAPKSSFDIHFMIRDSLSLQSLSKEYRSLVLLLKTSTDKKLIAHYKVHDECFYPFDSYYIKDIYFFHKDTYSSFNFLYQKGDDNEEFFSLDAYNWFYYDSHYVQIKRK